MKNKPGLLKEFNESIENLSQELEQFPWEDKDVYAHWLGQTYYLVAHTTRYLALTAGKFGVEHDELHKRALEHLREERGHDLMAIKDLKALKYKIEDIPELPETAAIYQSQYYWIEMVSPLSHFGYALMLEGLASKKGPFITNAIEKAHGKQAALFMRVHAADDVDHFEKGIAVLEGLAPERQLEIIKCLKQSENFYTRMLDGVLAHCRSMAVPKKKVA